MLHFKERLLGSQPGRHSNVTRRPSERAEWKSAVKQNLCGGKPGSRLQMAYNARCIQMYSSVTSDRRRRHEADDDDDAAHLALSAPQSKGQRGGKNENRQVRLEWICKVVCHDSDWLTDSEIVTQYSVRDKHPNVTAQRPVGSTTTTPTTGETRLEKEVRLVFIYLSAIAACWSQFPPVSEYFL